MPTRIAYGKFTSSTSEQTHICQHKASNEVNLPPAEKIDGRAVYQLAFQGTKSSKLITFIYKFSDRRLAANTFLKKIRVLEDDKCTFCHSEAESLLSTLPLEMQNNRIFRLRFFRGLRLGLSRLCL